MSPIWATVAICVFIAIVVVVFWDRE